MTGRSAIGMPTKSPPHKKGGVFSIGMLGVTDSGNFGIILQVELFARLNLWTPKPVRKTGLALWREILITKQQSRVREIQIQNPGEAVIVNRTGKIDTRYLQTEIRH